MWSLKFPREIMTLGASGRASRKYMHTKEEYLNFIKHAIKLTNLYTTVYNYCEWNNKNNYYELGKDRRYETVNVDRLYFDCDFKVKINGNIIQTDGYINMLKLHEWCHDNGEIKHQSCLTGTAYSTILSVTHNGLENKKGAVYNAQNAIIEKLDILTDPQVMGDIARVTRIPNTFNFKESARRFAIPLKENQLYLGDEAIRELAKKQQFGVKPIGTHAFDISKFDCAPEQNSRLSMPDFDETNIPANVDIPPAPDCIKRMLIEPELGWKIRPILIIWLRDKGLLLEETIAVLKKSLSPTKYRHCVFEERQPQDLYRKMMNMYLPKCSSITNHGYCNCKNENECGLR